MIAKFLERIRPKSDVDQTIEDLLGMVCATPEEDLPLSGSQASRGGVVVKRHRGGHLEIHVDAAAFG